MPRFWKLTGDISNFIVVLARDKSLLTQYPFASLSVVKKRLHSWTRNKTEREILEEIYAALPQGAMDVPLKKSVSASKLEVVLGNAFQYGVLFASEVKYPSITLGEVVVGMPVPQGRRTGNLAPHASAHFLPHVTSMGVAGRRPSGRQVFSVKNAQAVVPISKPGFIDRDDGGNIRDAPAELGGRLVRPSPLPPATPVFVSGSHPDAPQWWYVTAYAKDGIFRGYIQGFRVNVDLPEPTARLYSIEGGDTAEALAIKVFSREVDRGLDLRFYENVLLYVNQLKGRSGITGAYQNQKVTDSIGGGGSLKLIKGKRIWLVSPAFAKTLTGIVPAGSWTGGMAVDFKKLASAVDRGIKQVAQPVTDVLQSIQDTPRYVDEILREDVVIIRENLIQILGVIAMFLLAEEVSVMLASAPTLISQAIAICIQLVLAALGTVALAEELIKAAVHGVEWLRLAIHANGNATEIALASKELLRMLQSIALAALSYLGAKGNWDKAIKIGNSLPPPSAMAVAIAPNGMRFVGETALPASGVVTGRPGWQGAGGGAGAVMMHGEEDGGSPSESSKAEAESAASKLSAEIEAERAKGQNHVHEGEIMLDSQSPYHQKWSDKGLHTWEGVERVCRRDGFTVEQVTEDPATGVRRISIRRSATHPKTKKPVSGITKKTLYPKDLTRDQIDALGESALESAVQNKLGTTLKQRGSTEGEFSAIVNVGNPPRTFEIVGWYKVMSNGTRVLSSHAPKYDKNWPLIAPKDY
jgi:hypothetical protein